MKTGKKLNTDILHIILYYSSLSGIIERVNKKRKE
jgi:hypothetical protein